MHFRHIYKYNFLSKKLSGDNGGDGGGGGDEGGDSGDDEVEDIEFENDQVNPIGGGYCYLNVNILQNYY